MKRSLLTIIIVCTQLALHAADVVTTGQASHVTQSQATLWASFATGSHRNFFEYKTGTVPALTDFARVALSEASDPVSFQQVDKPWTARPARGWVESYYDPDAPQLTSALTTAVTLSQGTWVQFEWRVVSQPGVGLLLFKVDGEVRQQISGDTEFETVSVFVAAGEHTLSWEYQRQQSEDTDYGVGYLRNVNIANTTPGEWQSADTETDSLRLAGLRPGAPYLYRACSAMPTTLGNDVIYLIKQGRIEQFETLPIGLGTPTVTNSTQTTATLRTPLQAGDAQVEAGYLLTRGNLVTPSDFDQAMLSPLGDPVAFTNYGFRVRNGVAYDNHNGIADHYVRAVVTLHEPTTLSFNWTAKGGKEGNAEMRFRVYSGTELTHYLGIKAEPYAEVKAAPTVQLPAGTHTLEWKPVVDYIVGEYTISNVRIANTHNVRQQTTDTIAASLSDGAMTCQLQGLDVHFTYHAQPFVRFAANPDAPLQTGATCTFMTLQASMQTLGATQITQTQAVLQALSLVGDAPVAARGVQYRLPTAAAWSEARVLAAGDTLSARATRLRPSTGYEYRAYVQTVGRDTLFGAVLTFDTDTVRVLRPTVAQRRQHGFSIIHTVLAGDADLYTRGWQLRRVGDETWTTHEDVGTGDTFLTDASGLALNTDYNVRTFARPMGLDTIFSSALLVRTRNVEAYVDSITHVQQRSVRVHGRILPGDEQLTAKGLCVYQMTGDERGELVQTVPIALSADTTFTATVQGLSPQSSYGIEVWAEHLGDDGDGTPQRITSGQTEYEAWLTSDSIMSHLVNSTMAAKLLYNPAVADSVAVSCTGGWYAAKWEPGEPAIRSYVDDNYLRVDFVIGKRAWGDTRRTGISYEWQNAATSTSTIEVYVDGQRWTTHSYTSKYSNPFHQQFIILKQGHHRVEWRARGQEGERVYIKNLLIDCLQSPYLNRITEAGRVTTKSYLRSFQATNVTQTSADVEVNLEEPDGQLGACAMRCHSNNVPIEIAVERTGLTLRAHADSLMPQGYNFFSVDVTVDGQEYRVYEGTVYTKPVGFTVRVDSVLQTAAWLTLLDVDPGTAQISDLRYNPDGLDINYTNLQPIPADGHYCQTGLTPNNGLPVTIFYKVYGRESGNSPDYLLVGTDTVPSYSVTTRPVGLTPLDVTRLSNTSAQLNALIDFDGLSGGECGFEWKQKDAAYAERQFVQGQRGKGGVVSCHLPVGTLQPETDYEWRPMVRYLGNDYVDWEAGWQSFRTTLEDGIQSTPAARPLALAATGVVVLMNAEGHRVVLTDVAGRVAWRGLCTAPAQRIALPSGLYVVQIETCGAQKVNVK